MNWMELIFAAAVVIGGLVNYGAPSVPCPSSCKCGFKNKTATCGQKTKGLTYIPPVPGYVRHFTLLNGNLPAVDRSVLAPLSNHSLLSLTLATSRIRRLSDDAFVDCNELTAVDLRGNHIPVRYLKAAFGTLGSSLQNVVLRSMSIRFVPWDLFNNETALNVRHLDMGNNYKLVVELCRSNGSSVYPRLEYLNLDNNGLTSINSETFSCLMAIEHIEFNGNPIEVLANNTFSGLPHLKILHLMNLKSLRTVEELAFNSTSLEKLILSDDRIFKSSTFPGDFPFKWAPRLTELQLQRTRIRLSQELFRSMLLQLKSITYLNLQKTWLYEIPPSTLGQLPKLTRLDLQGNYLPNWNERTFANATSLRILNLDGCRISIINETSFPFEMRKGLKKINLGNNQFFCTCDLLWFRTWMNEVIRNNTVTFVNYPHRYFCKNIGRIRLDKYNPTKAACLVLSPLIIAAASVSIFAVILLTVSLVVYRNRWNIRYCMYSRRRKEYQKLPGRDTELKFDAFVSFDSHDMDWMMAEVCSLLENELGFKLCIHRRDFECAKMIIDNIMDCMEQSGKIILIISNDFAKSHWCRCEVQLALDEYFKNHKDVVIVIKEMVNKKLMFKALRALIATTTYIQWEDHNTAKKVFRSNLAAAMGYKGLVS